MLEGQETISSFEGEHFFMLLSEINDFLVNVYCRKLGDAIRSCEVYIQQERKCIQS